MASSGVSGSLGAFLVVPFGAEDVGSAAAMAPSLLLLVALFRLAADFFLFALALAFAVAFGLPADFVVDFVVDFVADFVTATTFRMGDTGLSDCTAVAPLTPFSDDSDSCPRNVLGLGILGCTGTTILTMFLSFLAAVSLPFCIPAVARLRYSSSIHFFFMASLIFLRCDASRFDEDRLRFLNLVIICARNSGFSHFFFRVSEMRWRTPGSTLPDATDLLVMSSRYSASSAHFFRRDSRIFCLVSSVCLKPRRTVEGSRGFRVTSPLAYFSLRILDILAFVSSVGVYPPLAVFLALRSASFFRRSAFFRSRCSSSVMPSSASLARNFSRLRRLTPSAMRALTSGDRWRPLFQGVLPLLAAEILALEEVVWVYPPLAVAMGTSSNDGGGGDGDMLLSRGCSWPLLLLLLLLLPLMLIGTVFPFAPFSAPLISPQALSVMVISASAVSSLTVDRQISKDLSPNLDIFDGVTIPPHKTFFLLHRISDAETL
mmetsp:Transcript_29752/g.54650  ORF Transcript_29752/g.54650 Transcript_29752/m.54650 type:complete len:488 (-) Transcript_29752:537-2000(-)